MLDTAPVVSAATDFEGVFRDAFEPMVRALTVASGSRSVAEDCVQEAFSRAFTRWRRIGGYEDPVGWVRHVAVNLVRDHHRKEQRKRRAVTRLGTQPEEVVVPPEPGAGLDELVAALPQQQRIAASLFYVEQLSVRETADAMDLSVGAVKYHLHAARTTLRRALEARP